MTTASFVNGFFEIVTTNAGRRISDAVLDVPSENWFPDGLPSLEDQALLNLAGEWIGGQLSNGEGEITACQLVETMEAYTSEKTDSLRLLAERAIQIA